MALHNRKNQMFDFRISSPFIAIFMAPKEQKMAKNGNEMP